MLRSHFVDAQNGRRHFTEQAWTRAEAGPEHAREAFAEQSENCGVAGNTAHRQGFLGREEGEAGCIGAAVPDMMGAQVHRDPNGGIPHFGSHTVVVKLLPAAYSSHCLLGAVYENLLNPHVFGAVIWDRVQLYTRDNLPSLAAAEAAGMDMLDELCAAMQPESRLMPSTSPADANATLYVSGGAPAMRHWPADGGAGAGGGVVKREDDDYKGNLADDFKQHKRRFAGRRLA